MRIQASVTAALLIAALGVGAASCAKTPPDSDTFPAARPNIRSWQEVRIYRGADLPECAYAEVRWVKAEHWAGLTVVERLKRAAWSAGGDAVVAVTPIMILDPTRSFLAIRFTDPECTH